MLAVSWDTIRLFLHVLAATIWVGGQLVLAALVPVLRRAGVVTEAAAFVHPQYYRSISRAMTSCWIWLVPS